VQGWTTDPEDPVQYPPTARLLMVRHAIAAERGDFARTGREDGERPLTDEGRARMRLAARGLRAQLDGIDLLATSPLARATQTAKIVAEAFDDCPLEVSDVLATGPADAFLSWYRTVADSGLVAVVGHEPYLGDWASWLLAGPSAGFFVFKKGGACLLEFTDGIDPGRAALRWHLAPAQLRALGGAT
jgi:phosphohistidine phosphatase